MSKVLLQVNNISKSYGPLTLLENASVSFSRHQKVGVIGRNGCGKSTLCKIITGEEEMDGGTVARNSELKLSYLEQHDPFKPEETVVDFLMRYTGKEEWECGRIAWSFQLKPDHLQSRIGDLSGGFQTRMKLAAMLLKDPNFLILDEPTNFLDLHTQLLLEEFLSSFKGGFLIVSHDREFLKKTCKHTLEVERGQLELYPGPIEEYFAFKQMQFDQKMSYNRGVEKKKKQLQDFVDRFRAKASKATQAKSKMKQLARMETIDIDQPLDTVKIRMPQIEQRKGVALRVQDLAMGYPDHVVAREIDLEIDRGSHVAVLGDNGQGKTTFLRTIAGELDARSGECVWAQGQKVGYYAQHVYRHLSPKQTVEQYLQSESADGVYRQEILDMAGCFLFQGHDVEKNLSVLSGGERARLVLAGLLLAKCNVLILDEPTNHLDFETVEALGKALRNYNGTLFFACHDRTFVSIVATHILDVKNGRVLRYPGTYQDYVDFLKSESLDDVYGTDSKRKIKSSSSKKPGSDATVGRKKKAGQGSKGNGQEPRLTEEEKAQLEAVRAKKKKIKTLKSKIQRAKRRIGEFKAKRESLISAAKVNPFYYSKLKKEELKLVTSLLEAEEDLLTELTGKLGKLQAASTGKK